MEQRLFDLDIRCASSLPSFIAHVDPIAYVQFQRDQPRGAFMQHVTIPIVALLSLMTVNLCTAQDRPFLFTFTPTSAETPGLFLQYGAAYGKQTFEPLGGDAVEQNLGVQANLSADWTVLGHFGMAMSSASTRSSQHLEVLAHVLSADAYLVDLRAGAGVRHEYSGTNVLLARAAIGRQFASWMTYGNLLLEKPLAADRDAIDVMLTLGLSYNVTNAFRVGLEAVGQDLEGFWDDEEAEGGARLFVGPTASLGVEGTPWHFTLGAGAIIRGSVSNRVSSALRDIPAGTDNGFLVRALVGFGL
jgi:hypothetical protein